MMDFKSKIFKRYEDYKVIGNSSYELHLRVYTQLTDLELLKINEIILGHDKYVSDYTKQLISVLCSTSGNIDDDWAVATDFDGACLALQYLMEIGVIVPLLFINENKIPITIYPDELMSFDYIKIL